MYEKFSEFLDGKRRICIIQAENPDGDSLGSALALSEILSNNSYEVSLYCPVNLPEHLRYFKGWEWVSEDFDLKADGYVIIDTAAKILLSKLLEKAEIKDRLYSAPVLVIDHHESEDDLDFDHESIIEPRPACCELIFDIFKDRELKLTAEVAEPLVGGIMSDTLGLTTATVTKHAFEVMAELVAAGADVHDLEERRRELMKKSKRILAFKGELIQRIDYSLHGRLATVHIPWEDIREYSGEYNPGALIIDELRLVKGVAVAIAIKTYPDGKVTGKIRTTCPIAEEIAGYFGGGGHPYAAGFRTFDTNYNDVLTDLTGVVGRLLDEGAKDEPETRFVGSF